MNYSTKHEGIENVICWSFKELGYRVLNPCEILKIYHLHCGIRYHGYRVNFNSFAPRPTNNLI